MALLGRAWVQGLLAGALLLSVVVVRVLVESRREMSRAEQLQSAGQLDEAIDHFRRAARWYAPQSPYVARSLLALAALAQTAEQRGQQVRALAAWRAIRSALLSTRSFYTPYPRQLAEANEHIATLMARQQLELAAASPAVSSKSGTPPVAAGAFEDRRAWHLALLQRSDAPDPICALIALLGCATWVGGALLFIYRGIGPEDVLQRRPALLSLLLVVAGFAAFIAGLRLA